MATIKLQPSGNVLIKDGKVSCGCCEGCCPYASQALFAGLYTYEDLPDTVLGTGIFGMDEFVMSKLDPPEPSIDSVGTSYYRGTSDGILYGIGINDDEAGDEWLGTELGNEDAQFTGCLFLVLGDQFANTYSVNGPVSGTVTRTSICTWEGTGLTLSNFGFQFKVNGNNKSGFQNTPEGSYAGGFTVS